MSDKMPETLQMNADALNELMSSTEADLQDFLEYARTLENPSPELERLVAHYNRAVLRLKAMYEGVAVATPTIRGLTEILNICLPALNEIAEIEINPHGNNYTALKEASRTANQARIQAFKLIP